MKKRIGITGGIGSGKTTICKIFESIGIPVYYADEEAKKLMISSLQVKKGIIDILGKDAYHANGKLNKPYISDKIFSDRSLLAKINKLIHPAVHTDAERWFETVFQGSDVPYAVKEAALLVESGNHIHLDEIIVVTCPENIRIQRVMERDKVSSSKVKERMENQMSETEKIAVADHIIINDGEHAILPQIVQIHKSIVNDRITKTSNRSKMGI
jgi:dephospho-CoA kinase